MPLSSSKLRRSLVAIVAAFLTTISAPLNLAYSEATLRSEITPGSGHKDDLFLFTVTIDGPQQRITPQIATSADFDLQLLGPKTSVSIVNGTVHSRQQYVYQLTPKREGELKTPEIQALVNGQTLSAPPIAVTIKTTTANPVAPSADNEAREEVFLRQSVSKTSAYVGEQIVNAITFFTRINLHRVPLEDKPADGFWQETISDGESSQTTVNGVEYGTAQVIRALYALKAGDLKIPERTAVVQVPVSQRGGNPFGGFDPFSDDFFQSFFQRTILQDKRLISNPLTVTIKPLPPAPNDLSRFIRGMTVVGETTITLEVSDTPLKVGESKNIAVVVKSSGHLKPLKAPPLNAPSGVKIYEGQSSIKHQVVEGKLITERTFNYSMIPMQPGLLRIPAVSLAYFDPHSESYRLATTLEATVVVAADANTSLAGTTKTDPNSSKQDTPVDPYTGNKIPENGPQLPQQGADSPALTYAEKTLLEAISERISVQLALLSLSAAIIFWGLITLSIKRANNGRGKRALLRNLMGAKNIEQLELLARQWACDNLSGITENATFDQIRAAIKGGQRADSVALEMISVLDKIEAVRYSSGGKGSLESIKAELSRAIEQW
jgi:hypothetical protein